jgi:hypothetical protein
MVPRKQWAVAGARFALSRVPRAEMRPTAAPLMRTVTLVTKSEALRRRLFLAAVAAIALPADESWARAAAAVI